jgi:RND family efflux transporter MFP subunit
MSKSLPGSVLAVALAAGGLACRSSSPDQGPPAMPVRIQVARSVAVDDTSEYVATLKSRGSAAIMPQVEGHITAIFVRSGAQVAAGAALMQIDPVKQQAAVRGQEDTRAAREAALQYARQHYERVRGLQSSGIASQQDFDQAKTALDAAEADLKAVEAQVREQEAQLRYYRVTAPAAGVVGDIPVRVGDTVTKSTELTTIDQNAGLEVYVNVPVQEAGHLAVGLPVQLEDDAGRVLVTTKVSFVAPSVDPGTQSVLAKAPLDPGTGFRTEQFVRARLVWTAAPALTVPLVSVNRINGQYFAFVAEGADGQTVARQRQVDLGALVGNDYVVKGGLRPGEKLIVSGIQKIADGAPVSIAPPAAPSPGAGGARGE